MEPRTKTEPDNIELDELDEDFKSDEEDPTIFRIREPLEPPRSASYALYDLFQEIHQGNIDLSPPYQRDVVWADSKQIMLIDSIWRNYHIPPIIFAVIEDEYGETIKRCVDGKQRLTSILRFIDGQIPHVDVKTKKRWFFAKPTNSKLLEIPEKFKSKFKKKQINCIEYHDLNEETERDIFQRVQLGMSLSSAEKQKAILSPWTQWFDDLVARYVSPDDGIPAFIKWNTKRERDFQCIGLLVMVCYYLPEYEAAVTSKLKNFIASPEEPSTAFRLHVQKVLSIFQELVSNDEYRTVITSASPIIAPVEFVYIGALISHVNAPASPELAGMVYNFRSSVRKEHRDIRMNDKVSKTMFAYIKTLKTRTFEDTQSDTYSPPRKKRKGAVAIDDDEYRPGRDG